MKKVVVLLAMVCSLASCEGTDEKSRTLPYIGNHQVNGEDTLHHQVPPFSFVDQDSAIVTEETLAGKVYVADFFFIDCPTICPKMKSQMLRIYEEFEGEEELVLMSHSINPADSVARLHSYAHEQLAVETDRWHFVTGNFLDIQELAQQTYMVTVLQTPDQPEQGGFYHNDAFVLVDKERHIRGVYPGTDPLQVDQLIKDIRVLLDSYNEE